MKPWKSYVWHKIGRKIVRVTGMSESLVRGTRTSDSELTTNDMTALNWTSTFLKMADTDLQNSRFNFLSSFTVNISLWNGANPRYKDRGIDYE